MLANPKRNKKGGASPKKIIISVLLVLFSLIVLGYLAFTNLKINQRRAELVIRADYLKKEIADLEKKKKELAEKIAQGTTLEYMEKVAREQLGYKAPGEEAVVISKENNESKETPVNQPGSLMNIGGWWGWLKSKF